MFIKLLFYFLALIAGASLSIEGAIGGTLRENIGEVETTFYMFSIGFMTLILFTLFLVDTPTAKAASPSPCGETGGILKCERVPSPFLFRTPLQLRAVSLARPASFCMPSAYMYLTGGPAVTTGLG
ncbi:DMT family transporter [Domibacillus sp. DTU_2020_1001157_1_SI_ALB_TIR_016]|uniref:DMT family transporter n=1 Tax=Domibacillus sp. DTU_2020_1001157_1_SI_ALB_TIR_016 TaxID=3077789 RepID=UPI0028EF920D|nr:DMT family transporter [Domibacillus sp. DTU_2020_1001157_1_SI_ALB_TIR_016]WNS82426.1 DMT family transporter [Domibacillus sp. DTU_2020_1001157_1_SI_ALB_TIR_016]